MGSDNIVIGAENFGVAAENGVIRIGVNAHQKKTFVAGIRGVKTGLAAAIPVFIDANGQSWHNQVVADSQGKHSGDG